MSVRSADVPFAILAAHEAPRRRGRWLDGTKGRIGAEIVALAAEQARWLPGMCAASGLTPREMLAVVGSDARSVPLRRLWAAVRRLRRQALPGYDPIDAPW